MIMSRLLGDFFLSCCFFKILPFANLVIKLGISKIIKARSFKLGQLLYQIKAPQFYNNFLKLISLVMDSSISEVEF